MSGDDDDGGGGGGGGKMSMSFEKKNQGTKHNIKRPKVQLPATVPQTMSATSDPFTPCAAAMARCTPPWTMANEVQQKSNPNTSGHTTGDVNS